jgi:hypothetical protein
METNRDKMVRLGEMLANINKRVREMATKGWCKYDVMVRPDVQLIFLMLKYMRRN